MTVTLTREEAQQVLNALEKVTKQMLSARDELAERGARPVTNTHHQKIWDRASEAYTDQAIPAAETLRAKVRRVEIWENRDLSKCECDHNEYCQHCWPLELRENKT